MQLPLPDRAEQQAIEDAVLAAEEAERAARELRAQAQSRVLDTMLMDSDHARNLLAAFKPPK